MSRILYSGLGLLLCCALYSNLVVGKRLAVKVVQECVIGIMRTRPQAYGTAAGLIVEDEWSGFVGGC